MVSEEDPKFLFLSKTKLDRDGFQGPKRKLNVQHGVEVPGVLFCPSRLAAIFTLEGFQLAG